MRTTMNLAPDVRHILRRESGRRGIPMTTLMEKAIRATYEPKPKLGARRLVRKNGRLVVAALPHGQPISSAQTKEVLEGLSW